MRGGDLDRVIVVERAAQAVSDAGTPTSTWTAFATLRAKLFQQSGREFVNSGATFDDRLAVFRTRWVDGVTPADRITYEGRHYDISDIRELGRRRGLEFHAVARGA